VLLGGDHVRADGRDSLLLVSHAPACLGRLDVRLLARLTFSRELSRVYSDRGFVLSCQLRRPLRSAGPNFSLCRPKLENLASLLAFLWSSEFPLHLFVRWFRFRPGVGVDARLRLKQSPRRHMACSLTTDTIWSIQVSLPTGAGLAWLCDLAGLLA